MSKLACRVLRGGFRRVFNFLNEPVRSSSWYSSIFLNQNLLQYPQAHCYKDWPRNFKAMALGSSMAYWGIDFESCGFHGVNFSNAPQNFLNDYRMLKGYSSLLKRNATVICVICPFSSVDVKETPAKLLRYLKVYANSQWLLDQDYIEKAKRLEKYPLLMGMPAVRAGISHFLGRDRTYVHDNAGELLYNPMSKEALREDAKQWIDGWKIQFHITGLEYPLTDENEFGRGYRIVQLRKIIDFCAERDFRIVLMYLPVTQYLSEYFSPEVREIYMDSFIRDLNRDVEVRNYFNDETFKDESLYFNSFFLNKRGRRLFTQRVLEDLGL